jgi:TctA family transporter
MITRFIAFALTLLLLTPGSILNAQESSKSARAAKRAAEERVKRCQDAVANAQAADVGTSVLSSAVGFLPFGSAAASAAANIGTSAAGELARRKAAADVQGNC